MPLEIYGVRPESGAAKTAQIYMLALGHTVNVIPDETLKALAKRFDVTPLEGVLE